MTRLPVIDRDEAHFAQATRQMMQTGQYFQIRFQDTTRFQKPPGVNWLQAICVRLFSNEDASRIWPYRLPSVLGALLSVLLTLFFARRFMDARAAWMGAAFLASSLSLVIQTHMAVIDASLLSSVVLMQGALWVIYHQALKGQRAHWGWASLFWVAMAYGFLLKGVTPLVGVLSIIALCLMERRVDWLRGFRWYQGLSLFILLTLAWVLPVNGGEHSNYLLQMVHKDLLPKLQGGHESHGQPPLFHLFILPLMFWPASLFLWPGGVYAFKARYEPVVRFLLAWVLPTWMFFEIMPTKLPQYMLPTFPAIALLCALGITVSQDKLGKPSGWAKFSYVSWGLLSIGFLACLFGLSYVLVHEVTVINVMGIVIPSLLSLYCVYLAMRGDYRRASQGVFLMALLVFPLMFSHVLPRLKPVWLSRNSVASLDRNEISEQQPLIVLGYAEPSLVFYLNTKHVILTDDTAVTVWMTKYPNSLILVNQDNLASLLGRGIPLMTVAAIHGYNYSKGRWITLMILKQVKRGNG